MISSNFAQENWRSALKSLSVTIQSLLLPDAAVRCSLNQLIQREDSPLSGLKIEFAIENSNRILSSGDVIGEPDQVDKKKYENPDSTIKVSLWLNGRNLEGSKNRWLMDFAIDLAIAQYKPEKRSQKTLLMLGQASQFAAASATLTAFTDKRGFGACLYCDLDNFKHVNDKIGHDAGDRVIKEFGLVIDEVCSDQAVALHISGDEFAVLCACTHRTDALVLAREVQLASARHDYSAEGISIGVTVGISYATRDLDRTYEEIVKLAEDSTKRPSANGHKGEKLRGLINVDVESDVDTSIYELAPNDLTSLCLARTGLGSATPFASLALNLISNVVSRTPPKQLEELPSTIDEVLSKLQQNWDSTSTVASIANSQGPLYGSALAPFDVSIAVLHGILRAFADHGVEFDESWSLQIKHDDSGESCRLLLDKPEPLIIWQHGDGPFDSTQEFGSLCRAKGEFDVNSCKDFLLLKIGHAAQMPCSSDLFLETIVLDDRPVQGGGLPDFWQSALARVVDTVVRHTDHFQGLIIWGDPEFAPQTIERLKNVGNWNEPEVDLSVPLAVKEEAIRKASQALDGKVFFPASPMELIQKILEKTLPYRIISQALPESVESEPPSVLPFQYVFDQFELELFDGCRVRTLADAYPLVLAICQDKCQSSTSEAHLQDQSGSPFTELVDFKVHVEEPFVDMIPAYLRKEEASFDSYYTSVFVTEGGLFQERLNRDKQLEAVVNHVRDIIHDGMQYATRRAILVIPHDLDDGSVNPLGLSAIRIIPRFSESNCVLHFSYTWRTVEAIVGFPYSIYGSAKYAQHLRDLITVNMNDSERERVKLGTLSYMASSLHYFLDPSMRRIGEHITTMSAKRIPRSDSSVRAL